MNTIEWKSYLKQESKKAIAHYQQNKNAEIGIWQHTELSAETIKSQWIGFPGATEDQLIAAETRLGVTLPPSYQTFLKVTNGWSDPPEGLGCIRLKKSTGFALKIKTGLIYGRTFAFPLLQMNNI